METLGIILPIILYTLGSILLIILIILGIKLIITMNKIEEVVDDIDGKVQSLNRFFSVVDFTTDKLSLLSDRMIEGIAALLSKLFRRKRKEEENEG